MLSSSKNVPISSLILKFPLGKAGKLYNNPVSIYNIPVNGGNGRSVVNGWGLVVGYRSQNK